MAMDWLKQFVKSNPILSLIVPTSVSGFSFIANLVNALSDGQIDSNELHNLLSTADGFQTVLLLLIMFAFKERRNVKCTTGTKTPTTVNSQKKQKRKY